MKVKFFIIISVMLLCGCSSVWVKAPSGSLYTLTQADRLCAQSTYELFPIKNEIALRTEMMNVERWCRKIDDCGNQLTYIERTPVTESYVLDVNKQTRTHYFYLCMNEKGWYQENIWIWQ